MHVNYFTYLIIELLMQLLTTEPLQRIQEGDIPVPESHVRDCHQTDMPEEGVCYPVGLC